MTDAAQKFGFDDAEALAAYLMYDEAGQTSIINLSMHPDDVDAVARLPYASVISDALYADSDTPHPRKFGAMPRLWTDFVRARHVLAPEEAIRKMTRMPAERLGLKGRGTASPRRLRRRARIRARRVPRLRHLFVAHPARAGRSRAVHKRSGAYPLRRFDRRSLRTADSSVRKRAPH